MDSECIIDNYGSKYWFKPGTKTLHREDGPAVEYPNGVKVWYIEGNRHRIDGPAIEGPAEHKVFMGGKNSWYIEGRQYWTKEEWYDALTPEQKKKAIWKLHEL